MEHNPLVSVIILNWNGQKYLKDCLISLESQSYKNFELILVDNGSKDESVFFVKQNFKNVIIIANKKNYGFAKGNNIGISSAKGSYIFLVNNDTRVEKNCIKNLMKIAEKKKTAGMFAPKILSFENPKLIDSTGLNIYRDGLARGRGRLEIDAGQYNDKLEILIPSGCAALYRKKMLKEVGLFDEIFFAYCEDTDLGLRGRLMGWKCLFVPSAVVYHHYSGSTGKFSEIKAFLAERNHFWVVFKNFPLSILILLPFYTLLRYLFIILGIIENKGPAAKFKGSKIKLIAILIKAYASFAVKLPYIIRKRILIQKTKKISSKEIKLLIKKHRLNLKEITFLE